MAKDNVPFHTIMWPAMILGTQEPWKQVDDIKALNWLTYYGKKFSTSQKFGIFCDQALTHYTADYWRYALMCMSPESDDAKFTWELFQGFVNTDLANNFGNFINRTWRLVASKCDGQVPTGNPLGEREKKLQADINMTLQSLNTHFYEMEFRRVVADLRALWDLANGYIDERAPWSLLKTDVNEAHMVLNVCVHLGRIFAQAAWPIIPFASERVLQSLSFTGPVEAPQAILSGVCDGQVIQPLDILFKRIEPEEIDALKTKYGFA
jgi:methionyl-tRNA synthetase